MPWNGWATARRGRPAVTPRLKTTLNGEHHITVPNHDPLRIGTLAAILASVATHHRMTRDAVIERLLG
jgi:hypothetical protein